MKLLLTSGGLRNATLEDNLVKLVGKPAESIKLVYILTAANVEPGNKDWLINNLKQMSNAFGEVDIIDLAVLESNEIRERVEWADAIVVGGGNTYYLLYQVRKSGLDKILPGLLEKRVYVGISAGSIIMTPSINVAEIDDGDKNDVGLKDTSGLGFVDFEVSPHTPESVSHEANQEYAKSIRNKLISFDDNMAVKVDGDMVEIVGEGKYWEYNA